MRSRSRGALCVPSHSPVACRQIFRDRAAANAAPPGCLRGVGAACPFFRFPQRGVERREAPWGLARPPVGNLRLARPALAVACAKKRRDCEFRPEAPSWVPSGCEPKGYRRRRLPALHPAGKQAPPAAATTASLSDAAPRPSLAPRHDGRRRPEPGGVGGKHTRGLLSRTFREPKYMARRPF